MSRTSFATFPFSSDPLNAELQPIRRDGPYVRWIQQTLNRILGAHLGVDGVIGTETRNAIRSFQQRQRLAIDGIVGPLTQAALIRAGAPRPPAAPAPAPAPRPAARPPAAAPAAPMATKDPGTAVALARWRMATGIPATPFFYQLVDRYRPAHLPLPLLVAFSSLEASGWLDATHGNPPGISPEFYELGVFQVPAGSHGGCRHPRFSECDVQPPGNDPQHTTAWFKLCDALKLDPKNWKDPVTQVRVGIANLEKDAQSVRRLFPTLFPNPGSDWALRAAVLLPFGPGIGYTVSLLKQHRPALQRLPEPARWQYLRDHKARTKNADDKMARARSLAVAVGQPASMPAA